MSSVNEYHWPIQFFLVHCGQDVVWDPRLSTQPNETMNSSLLPRPLRLYPFFTPYLVGVSLSDKQHALGHPHNPSSSFDRQRTQLETHGRARYTICLDRLVFSGLLIDHTIQNDFTHPLNAIEPCVRNEVLGAFEVSFHRLTSVFVHSVHARQVIFKWTTGIYPLSFWPGSFQLFVCHCKILQLSLLCQRGPFFYPPFCDFFFFWQVHDWQEVGRIIELAGCLKMLFWSRQDTPFGDRVSSINK